MARGFRSMPVPVESPGLPVRPAGPLPLPRFQKPVHAYREGSDV